MEKQNINITIFLHSQRLKFVTFATQQKMMKYAAFLFSFFFALHFFGQIGRAAEPNVANVNSITFQGKSNLTHVTESDTAFLKVILKNAFYDIAKNNLPYYTVNKITEVSQHAKLVVEVLSAKIATQQQSQIIKKEFGKYLTNNFETDASGGICKGEYYNTYKIFPFRINANNEVEELVDYTVEWVTENTAGERQVAAVSNFTNSSVLATGKWYKIGLTNTGMYKLNKAFLVKAGIDVATLDPKKIRIFGNGGSTVPELNGQFRYDDLRENAIYVKGENDGVFHDTDYVVFYGTETTTWSRGTQPNNLKFLHSKNIYSDTSYYFINTDIGTGLRMGTALTAAPANAATNSYDYYNYHESDNINFLKSGRLFVGEFFDIINSANFGFNDGNFITADSIIASFTMAGRGENGGQFTISGNGLNANLLTAAVNVTNYLAPYCDIKSTVLSGLNNNSNQINFTVSKSTPNFVGWLDKFTVNARRSLSLNTNKQFCFRDTRITQPGNVTTFNINNASQPPFLYNVSNPFNVTVQPYNLLGNNLNFTCSTDTLLNFAVVPGSDFYEPQFIAKVENQNLHNIDQADYVLIAHPLFISQAQKLGNLHQQHEGFTYAIASTEEIYNEFSSGKPDASAIRDFIRMLYSRNIGLGKQVKYVALLGDGSYRNKDRNLSNNSALIPTYQSPASNDLLNSVATDDFYGLMDPLEGANAESYGKVDVGVGRLVGRNTAEMSAMVSKIESYYKKSGALNMNDLTAESCNNAGETTMSDWRNWLMFLADDEDNALHMDQANSLAEYIKNNYPNYNLDKVFLDAYQQLSTPGGQRVPDAYEEMQRRIKRGALVFNYTGHGGEVGLTAERLIDVPTINNWDNINRLPLFITATCEFTRYDDPARTSAGELCLLNSKGGAIALFTTCRLAISSTNLALNQEILKYLFKKLPNGEMPCLGDVIQRTKSVALSQNPLYANFHLIGDPALRLAYPQQKVFTTKINNQFVTNSSSDTLNALEKITISGMVADTLGNKLTSFNGLVYPTIFDKEQSLSCLINDRESAINYLPPPSTPSVLAPFKFNIQKNILYRGKVQVINGDFTFSFLVPKDISFAVGPGKISYYASNGQIDAAGFYKNVYVGGASDNIVNDTEGPKIELYMNNNTFVNGGTTNEKPIMYANLIDSSGINTVGTGIGHDITAILDANSTKPVVLNDFYEANLNSYQSGRVRYPFDKLPEGEHKLTFKVWDIQNNSNTTVTDFVVAPSAELALKRVLNYPNPFTTNTKFFLEHNQACTPLKISIQIYTISGKVVKTIQKQVVCEGFRPEGIEWDGKDDYGDKIGRGVYIYKLAITNKENKKAEKIEKLVILN
jgi:hypothetical protein